MPKRQQWTGAKAASAAKVTPEILALMVDLLPTIGSLRDLCSVTGLGLEVVRRAVAPFLAIMKLQGAHPKCGCGRDRFHPYGCVDSFAKSNREGVVPGHRKEDVPSLLARRTAVIRMLVEGERFVDVDTALGLYPKSARKFLRFMTPEQIEARAEAMNGREPAAAREAALA